MAEYLASANNLSNRVGLALRFGLVLTVQADAPVYTR